MSNRNNPKPIFLVDEKARQLAIEKLKAEPVDGTRKVTFAGAKDKTARQRGLQWMWYGDIVKSGIGGEAEENEHELHLTSKARWCLPIQVRDSDDFADVWLSFYRRWQPTPEWDGKFRWFCDNIVSTEDLNQSQMAEYLTRIQEHYGHDLGVDLTDPDERGWSNLLEGAHG